MLPENASTRRYNRTEPDIHGVSDDRARMLLGLPPRHTAHVCQPRAFRADDPSKASSRGIRYAHRSHKHYSRESEA